MRKVIISLCLILVTVVSNLADAAKLIPPNDFTYLGAFTLPAGTGDTWMGYGAETIAYNPLGNGGLGSLFIEDKNLLMKIGEFSIPTPLIRSYANIGQLNQATLISPGSTFYDVSGGRLPSSPTYPKMSVSYIPQLGSMTAPRLFWTVIDAYQNSNAAMGWSSLDFSTLPSSADGSWSLNGISASQYPSCYAFMTPQAWADAHTGGKSLIVGGDRVGGGGSFGPSFYAIAPWAVGDHPANGTALASTLLATYTASHPLDHYATAHHTMGAVWVSIGSKNAILVSRHRALREVNPADYNPATIAQNTRWAFETYKGNGTGTGAHAGNGHDYCPECDQYDSNPSGPTATPYTSEILFFDPDDLAAVAAGTKQPYEPQPYAYWNTGANFYKQTDTNNPPQTIGGIAYDPVGQRLFVAETFVTGTVYPVIHVFQISDSGATAINTSPPNPPANVAHTAGAVSWTASTSTNGGIFYAVLKHYGASGSDYNTGAHITGDFWKPVVITRSTSWTDPYYTATDATGYQLSDDYQVVAIDQLMNYSLDYVAQTVFAPWKH